MGSKVEAERKDRWCDSFICADEISRVYEVLYPGTLKQPAASKSLAYPQDDSFGLMQAGTALSMKYHQSEPAERKQLVLNKLKARSRGSS